MENKYDAIMARLRSDYVPRAVVATEVAVKQFEGEIGYELPPDYHHFLLKYGYSHFDGNVVSPPVDPLSDEDVAGIEVFFGLGGTDTYDLRQVRRVLLTRPDTVGPARHLLRDMLAIASSPGGLICLALGGKDQSSVYWWGSDGFADEIPEDEMTLLAPDFDQFMAALRLDEP